MKLFRTVMLCEPVSSKRMVRPTNILSNTSVLIFNILILVDEYPEAEYKKWVDLESRKSFDLYSDRLYQFVMIRFNDYETGYFVKLHHMIADHASYKVERLFREAKVLEIIEGSSQVLQSVISNYGLTNYKR
ncbi:hypothetical protein PMSD_25105 [Paenibacillus macquariensis subsp. defensor]|nr:hypothetical protein PMSD_25105 [Paenibacillus macquariensis subsp. defensor]